MKIDIFNVELGQCAVIYTPNGHKIMIDTGHNATQSWYPSEVFRGQNIERLIVSNFDEDHLSDFVDLRSMCSVQNYYWNGSVSAAALRGMKQQGMGSGVAAFYSWLQTLEQSVRLPATATDLAGVTLSHYCNSYGAFADTNNLSLVTFAKYENFSILFPGDIETAGWEELLKNVAFQNELRNVNVLVASHHGRENGCCPEIFDYCHPQAVIISDDYIQHGTQETTSWYGSKASGCITQKNASQNVITTRNDGHISISVGQGKWGIVTESENRQSLLGSFIGR